MKYPELVCPRDKSRLTESNNELTCDHAHIYPIVRGIPVLLVPEEEETHDVISRSTRRSLGEQPQPEDDWEPTEADPVHFSVQACVAAACGRLYEPLKGKLRAYPIPEIRLEPANGEPLLDIGCMWGRWSVSAARKGYSVTGIDPDLGCIFAARKMAKQLGIEARFIVADARYLPFPDNSFQTAFSYSVIQHFSKENARLAIGEIGRVLNRGGKSLIQMPNKFGLRSLIVQARQRNLKSIFRVRYWSPQELRNTFAERIGPSDITVDGFFGLGIQRSDLKILPRRAWPVVLSSEALRKTSLHLGWLKNAADSLYVQSVKIGIH